MKKRIALILAFVMVLGMAGCGDSKKEPEPITIPEPAPESMPEQTEEESDNEKSEEESSIIYSYKGEIKDLVTIEEIELEHTILSYRDNANYFFWKLKVRNTSGNDLIVNKSSIRIWYNYLDENRDIVWGSYITGGYNSTIKDGQAILLDNFGIPSNLNKRQLESIVYIEIYGYTITLMGTPDHEFTVPIIIDVKDRKVIQAPSENPNTDEQDIFTILTSNEWVRTAPAGNLIVMTFSEDGTGTERYNTDMEDSIIEWEIDDFQIVKILIHLSDGTATTENMLVEENGKFQLVELAENGSRHNNPAEHTWITK